MTAIRITPENAKIIFARWDKELKMYRKSVAHIPVAQTVLLQPLFKPKQFALVLSRLIGMELLSYKRNV